MTENENLAGPPDERFNAENRQNSRGSRIKNKDENPQEFEEVGSQEEQSQSKCQPNFWKSFFLI